MIQLPVIEMFYSLQGEGKNSGTAAYFIRLAGCNVGCGFCDEKRAWSVDKAKMQSIEQIIRKVKESNARNVVVTGGEPTLYNLTCLTHELRASGVNTFLETSGVNEITGYWDWITVSPKKYKPVLDSVLHKADEIKVVISEKDDFLFAQAIRRRRAALLKPSTDKAVYCLQPEYSSLCEILPLTVEYIKENPLWRLSLQTHKMIGIK
ncbi:MAG: 7-carboxy-7-deazaguanine synthase QueE [Bacteroidales bacterium]|nr:7-carboxy-7-deazaguanine synthase QueE [Bacteroidales bacterium]